MGHKHVVLEIQLSALKNFLDHVLEETSVEFSEVETRNEAGEFEELDDYENASFFPSMRQEIASRAIYYEINALIEREMQECASPFFLVSEKHRKWQEQLPPDTSVLDALRSAKFIYDLPYGQITQYVEDGLQIKLSDLDGYKVISNIREVVNSFKHRNRFVDFRKQKPEDVTFTTQHHVGIEQAYEAINQGKNFIYALWRVSSKKSGSN